MRFYIASKLENHERVSRLATALKAAGHIHTYDWTAHCSVKDEGEERIKQVAASETRGVVDADFVIVLLPGGRGTHAELGIALGYGNKQAYLRKHIVLCSADDTPFQCTDETCAFYWLPEVAQVVGNEMAWLTVILAGAKEFDDAQPREA